MATESAAQTEQLNKQLLLVPAVTFSVMMFRGQGQEGWLAGMAVAWYLVRRYQPARAARDLFYFRAFLLSFGTFMIMGLILHWSSFEAGFAAGWAYAAGG